MDRTGAADEHNVSAATILVSTTAANTPVVPGEDPSRSLSRSLDSPSPPATKDELTAAFGRPAEQDKHDRSGAHGAKAHEKKGDAKDKTKADARRKDRHENGRASHEAGTGLAAKKRHARGAGAADSDVALLEALISHARPASKGRAAKKPARTQACDAPAGGDEGGTTRAAECKPQPVGKAAS